MKTQTRQSRYSIYSPTWECSTHTDLRSWSTFTACVLNGGFTPSHLKNLRYQKRRARVNRKRLAACKETGTWQETSRHKESAEPRRFTGGPWTPTALPDHPATSASHWGRLSTVGSTISIAHFTAQFHFLKSFTQDTLSPKENQANSCWKTLHNICKNM